MKWQKRCIATQLLVFEAMNFSRIPDTHFLLTCQSKDLSQPGERARDQGCLPRCQNEWIRGAMLYRPDRPVTPLCTAPTWSHAAIYHFCTPIHTLCPCAQCLTIDTHSFIHVAPFTTSSTSLLFSILCLVRIWITV